MYFGPAAEAVSYFAGQGFECPQSFNPRYVFVALCDKYTVKLLTDLAIELRVSDFFLDTVSIDVRSHEQEVRPRRGSRCSVINIFLPLLLYKAEFIIKKKPFPSWYLLCVGGDTGACWEASGGLADPTPEEGPVPSPVNPAPSSTGLSHLIGPQEALPTQLE